MAADEPIVFGASEEGEAHVWTLMSEEELTPTNAFDRHRWSHRRVPR